MDRSGKELLDALSIVMIVGGGGITIFFGINTYYDYLSRSNTYQINGLGVIGIIVGILGVMCLIIVALVKVDPDIPIFYGPQPPIQMPCPVCGQLIQADFLRCSSCGTQLKKYCATCGKQIDTRATRCQYCGAPEIVATVKN